MFNFILLSIYSINLETENGTYVTVLTIEDSRRKGEEVHSQQSVGENFAIQVLQRERPWSSRNNQAQINK